jgi:hypothetical protein
VNISLVGDFISKDESSIDCLGILTNASLDLDFLELTLFTEIFLSTIEEDFSLSFLEYFDWSWTVGDETMYCILGLLFLKVKSILG